MLLFPADGAMCLIPWAALTDRRGRYLLEAHALRVVPCLGMLARIHSTLDGAAVSSFGRPGRPPSGLASVRARPSVFVSVSVFSGVYLQMYVLDMAYVSCAAVDFARVREQEVTAAVVGDPFPISHTFGSGVGFLPNSLSSELRLPLCMLCT